MRVRQALLVLAFLALALPATASAGEPNFGRHGGGRAAPARGPSPRPAPRASAPRATAPRASAPRASAPRAASRPARTDSFRGQPVPAGRQRTERRTEPRTAPRTPSRTVSGAPASREPRTGTRGQPVRALGFSRGSTPARKAPTAGQPSQRVETAPRHAGSTPGFRTKGGISGASTGGTFVAPSRITPQVYQSAWQGGYRVGYRGGHFDWYHGWFDDHRWYLSFSFGASCGPYFGVSYYRPYHSWVLDCDYAFFYPAPVTYCYVPFGFYTVSHPYYVTRYEYVTVPVVVYEERVALTEEEIAARGAAGTDAAPEGEVKVADPVPAAGSPATEKFLREASAHFGKREYYEAAVKFRLAALSSPELPGPLFALGQSLMAMGQDAYAARVLRKAVEMSPRILEETGDVSGVWETPEEFDRVMKELEARAEAAPADGDARFLLAAERYFAGDVRSREAFDALHTSMPADAAVDRFREAAGKRFKGPDDLPAIEKK